MVTELIMSHSQTLNIKATRLVLTSTHQWCSALVAQWEQMQPVTSAVFAQTVGNKNVPLVRFLLVSVCGASFMATFIYNMAVRKGKQFSRSPPSARCAVFLLRCGRMVVLTLNRMGWKEPKLWDPLQGGHGYKSPFWPSHDLHLVSVNAG